MKRALAGWWDDNVPRLGASLAYCTLFARSPVLLVATQPDPSPPQLSPTQHR